MSGIHADLPSFDARERRVRIDRSIAETRKYDRERWLLVVAAPGGLAGAIAAAARSSA